MNARLSRSNADSYYSGNLFSRLEADTVSTAPAIADDGFGMSEDDVIFVTVSHMNRTVTTLTLKGCSSAGQLLEIVRGRMAGVGGLVAVEMRNRNRGTNARRVMRLPRPAGSLLRAQMKGYAA